MKIDKHYRIEKDPNQFILVYEEDKVHDSGKRKGEKYTAKDTTYHISLKDALLSYMNKAVDVSENASTVLSQLDSIEDTIKDLLTVKNK